MPSDPFAQIAPDDPVEFSSVRENAMRDAARAFRDSQFNSGAKELAQTRSSTIIRVRNETGSDLPRFSVLGLNGPIFDPGDGIPASLEAFHREVAFRGVVPTLADHKRRYVVTLEPAPVNRIVRAFVAGVCHVQIDLRDLSHEYATIVADTTHLKSSCFGHAKILWKERDGPYGGGYGVGVGYAESVEWAIIELGVQGPQFAVGKAIGDISPRSGLTLGTGTVGIYMPSAGDEDGPVETIDVLNNSSDLMAGGASIVAGTHVGVSVDPWDNFFVFPSECGEPYS